MGWEICIHFLTMAPVHFRVSGLAEFDLDLDGETSVRDVKKMASEECDIEPEHMRILYKGREFKGEDMCAFDEDDDEPVQVMYTAGHELMAGGGKPQSANQKNPFNPPVRGIPGSKGLRSSRISARLGGDALIRKYGIMLKRQEFREKAEEIGFRKYR